MFTPQCLLVWDSFRCHISNDTKAVFKKIKVQQAVITGECTGFIQAPDICWNKPFKYYFSKRYDTWFESGKQEYTAAGNPRSAPLEDLIEWIVKAWGSLSRETILNSFKVTVHHRNLQKLAIEMYKIKHSL